MLQIVAEINSLKALKEGMVGDTEDIDAKINALEWVLCAKKIEI